MCEYVLKILVLLRVYVPIPLLLQSNYHALKEKKNCN